jgi:hypothetical protein
MVEGSRAALAGRVASPVMFDLQQFAGPDDDDLPDLPALELTDDVNQLKTLARTLHRDLGKVRYEAGRRRIALREATEERDAARTELQTVKSTLEAEITKTKGELETANRSNGQLRTKFKDQFVTRALKEELRKAGAPDDVVPVIMKSLDLAKVEFDEETLSTKGADALVAEFKTASPSLFSAKGTPRGTNPGKNNATGNPSADGADPKSFDFTAEDNKNKSFIELARESARLTLAGG